MKTLRFLRCALECVAVLSLLAACGGGGGGSGDFGETAAAVTVTDFPFASALAQQRSVASTTHYTVSGSCTGAATEVASAPVTSSFDGTPAQERTITVTSNATPAPACSGSDVTRAFFDASFVPLGDILPDGSRIRYSLHLPRSLNPGDSGTMGTSSLYADATSSTALSTLTYGYAARTDPADGSLLVTVTISGSSGSQVDTYRGSADRSIRLVTRQFASGGAQVTFTAN